jgi:hypothetical protein
MANFLLHNQGGKSFDEIAVEAGVAYGEDGKGRSGHGVDAADCDNDDKLDLSLRTTRAQRYLALQHGPC